MKAKESSTEMKLARRVGIWVGIASSILSGFGWFMANVATTNQVEAKFSEVRGYVDEKHQNVVHSIDDIKGTLDDIKKRIGVIDERTWELNGRKGPNPVSQQ